jgi:hypothetical protein
MLRGSSLFILVIQHCYNEELAGGCVGKDMWLGQGERRIYTEFWRGNLLGNIYFEDRKGDERITLKYILWRYGVKVGSV